MGFLLDLFKISILISFELFKNMHFLKHYYNHIIKFDLINKFNYKTIKFFPNIKKIVLMFRCNTSNIKILISTFLAVEVILAQKTKVTISKNSNLLIKIK